VWSNLRQYESRVLAGLTEEKEHGMANVKLVVMYPRPKDIDAFEKIYQNEHVPLAVEKLEGKTKIVATKILASPQGTSPFYRIAEIYFRSMADLEECAASDGGKEALAHAVMISSGGPPIFLVAEEETSTFAHTAGASV
jgi:uncharacterized protein (TIGR02118 family)